MYEAPRIEKIVSAKQLEREAHYGGSVVSGQ